LEVVGHVDWAHHQGSEFSLGGWRLGSSRLAFHENLLRGDQNEANHCDHQYRLERQGAAERLPSFGLIWLDLILAVATHASCEMSPAQTLTWHKDAGAGIWITRANVNWTGSASAAKPHQPS